MLEHSNAMKYDEHMLVASVRLFSRIGSTVQTVLRLSQGFRCNQPSGQAVLTAKLIPGPHKGSPSDWMLLPWWYQIELKAY